jgi:hypothetical protein
LPSGDDFLENTLMIRKKWYFNADVAKNLFFLSFLWGTLTSWIMVFHLGVWKGFLVPPREIDGICYFRFLKRTLWASMGYLCEILWDWFIKAGKDAMMAAWDFYEKWKMMISPLWFVFLKSHVKSCENGLRLVWAPGKVLLRIEMWLRDNALPTGSGHFVIYWLVEVSSFEYSMCFAISHVLAFVRDGWSRVT